LVSLASRRLERLALSSAAAHKLLHPNQEIAMIRLALAGLGLLAAVTGLWCLAQRPALAQPQFEKVFQDTYMKEGGPLFEAFKEGNKCNICHIGGVDDRKHLNHYGTALGKLLDESDAKALMLKEKRKNPKAAKKAEEKIKAALASVEKEASDPKDKTAPSFGELIKTRKLPLSPATLPKELKE
jgi:hypothetical protein